MQRKFLLVSAFLLIPASALVIVVVSLFTGAPGNIWLILLGLLIGWFAVAYFLLPVALFLALSRPLLRGEFQLSPWSLALLGVSLVAVTGYFISAWHFGVEYQGLLACTALAYVNAAMALFLIGLAVRNRLVPRARTNFFFNWFFVLWVATFAFPYLGELI